MSALPRRVDTSADHEGFGALYQGHHERLRRLARMLCGDIHQAEDLVQETWLRAWRALGSLQEPGAARAWLVSILKREYARLFERQAPPFVDLDPDCAEAAREPATEAQIFLTQVLGRLTADEREPLWLHAVDGLSTAEIADRWGVSRNAMTIRIHRARKRLAKV